MSADYLVNYVWWIVGAHGTRAEMMFTLDGRQFVWARHLDVHLRPFGPWHLTEAPVSKTGVAS